MSPPPKRPAPSRSRPAASGSAARQRPSGASKPSAAPRPTLHGLNGKVEGKSFALRGKMVVGRIAESDIQLEDDSVSRRHAEITVAGREVTVKDAGSANGSTLNGEPLTDEVALNPGDILQFGVIEMRFDLGAGSPASMASQRQPPAAGGPKSRVLLVAGAAAALVALALVGLALKAPAPQAPRPVVKAPVDPCALKEEYLAQARQYSSFDLGEPNWEKAEGAAKKVLDCDPIDKEGNELMRRITLEASAEEAHVQGKKLMQRNREEEALDLFKKIPRESSYYLKTLPLMREAIDGVRKKAAAECKAYAQAEKWAEALPRCLRYADIACGAMKPDELQPGPLEKVNLWGGALRKGEWRPKDPMLLAFFKAKEKADPSGPKWSCPHLGSTDTNNAGANALEKELKAKFKEKELGDALWLYFRGKAPEGFVVLQKVTENISKATMHSQARELMKDISNVEQLYKEGSGELGNNRPDKADPSFSEALQIDERLIVGGPANTPEKKKELDKLTSYYRRNIQQEMASSSYARGKDLADRGDRKQACKVWKLGVSYWKGNTDLLRAVTNVCTAEAGRRMAQASSCDDLAGVIDFAVDGDGYKEQVEKMKGELACP